MIRADFGFLPCRLELTTDAIAIETQPALDEIIADLEKQGGVEGDWVYAPPQQVRTFDGVHELPYPSRIFGLPKTHIIRCLGTDDREQLQFHVWVLSFFLGIRLTTTEAGFLDATPIKPHKLTDFHVPIRQLSKVVTLAEETWSAHGQEPNPAKIFCSFPLSVAELRIM